MEDYVTIKGEDIKKIGCNMQEVHNNHDGKIERYELYFSPNRGFDIPTSLLYPKVKMTQAEKDEFDKLKKKEH